MPASIAGVTRQLPGILQPSFFEKATQGYLPRVADAFNSD